LGKDEASIAGPREAATEEKESASAAGPVPSGDATRPACAGLVLVRDRLALRDSSTRRGLSLRGVGSPDPADSSSGGTELEALLKPLGETSS
jgi:hypothetical protein